MNSRLSSCGERNVQTCESARTNSPTVRPSLYATSFSRWRLSATSSLMPCSPSPMLPMAGTAGAGASSAASVCETSAIHLASDDGR